MSRASPGTSSNKGAASGPAAMVTHAPGKRSIRCESSPVERTASPTRVAVTKRIFMRPGYRSGSPACQACAPRLPLAALAEVTPESGEARRLMAERVFAELSGRGLLEVAGDDRVAFLQGLVSNDVTKASATRALFAALLTAQGRYLFDFFIFALGDALYLETEAARLSDLQRRLSLYKLRSKIALTDASPRFAVAAAFGEDAPVALGLAGEGAAKPFAGGIAF